MRKYGKRMMALCLALLMLMLAVVPSSASEAGITDQETVLLTVEKNGKGEVEITGEQVVQEAEDRYAVKAGNDRE